MSDFHEMVTHLRMQEERSLLMENHANIAEWETHRSGNYSWHFSYLDYLPKNSDVIDLRTLPQQEIHKNPDA